MIGLSGGGKTSVAPLLAQKLGRSWEDLDRRVEVQTGRTVSEIFGSEGEQAFRRHELRALESVLREAAVEPAELERGLTGRTAFVLACGGGIVTNRDSRDLLRAGATVVWLRVSPEVAATRLGGAATRPLLSGPGPSSEPSPVADRLRALAVARDPLYRETAAIEVETDERTMEDVANQIVDSFRGRWARSGS